MTDFRRIVSGQDRSERAHAIRAAASLARLPYAAAIAARNLAYDRGWKTIHRGGVPVISVGNLTVGGTGKTPAVALFCRKIRSLGLRVAIVSRGYAANSSGVNDEALELEMQLPDVPHVQSPDRVAAVKIAVEELETEAIVMDDGFQHRRLHRELDIVLIDATNPWGHNKLLPRGLLREPVSSLARADVAIATRSDQVGPAALEAIRTRVMRHSPACVWATAVHAPAQLRGVGGAVEPLELLRGRRCFVFSGIGNPDAFAATVESAGGQIAGRLDFPDHHAFAAEDIERLRTDIERLVRSDSSLSGERGLLVLCTGKDLTKVNLQRLAGRPLYSLDIALRLTSGETEVDAALAKALSLS